MEEGKPKTHSQKRSERNRLYVANLKAVSECKDCGSRENLTFDHLPWFHKRGTIATLMTKVSRRTLLLEIAKCEIVCDTCHKRRENKRGRSNHSVPDRN